MRLGIDVRELQSGRSTGIGRWLRQLLDCLAGHRPAHEVFLYANPTTDVTGLAARAVRVAPEAATLWWDQVVLPSLARNDQLDVFLSPYVKGPVHLHCRLAITIHDLMFLVLPEYNRWYQQPARYAFRALARRVVRRADLVFADSQWSAQDAVRLLDAPAARLRVTPLGVSPAYHAIGDPAAEAALRSSHADGKPYILYVGNFKPHKNVDGLLQAWGRLPEPLRRTHRLLLAGRDDRWRAPLVTRAHQLGVAAEVHFIGAVAEADLPGLYRAALGFAFPSRYEGFGLPPLEAMACGTPVVASDRTSIPEVVGDAALPVDPDDATALSQALARLMTDAQLCARLRQRGLARAARFAASDCCTAQIRHLEALVERGTA
jgi:glycosyltransferase involved in cell wall biosynthesis